MLYNIHDWQRWGLKTYFGMMANAMSWQAHMLTALKYSPLIPPAYSDMAKLLLASAEISERFSRDYHRPEFNLNFTRIDNKNVMVNEETIDKRDFCSLIHFNRDTARNDPKVLIVVPTSGHFPTLLRETIAALLPHHDVYLTNWENARDVPVSAGEFGLDNYIEYTQDFIRQLGSDVHVIGFSQSTVPVLASIALMAGRKDDVKPLSMTLMGGPIDTRAAHSEVSKFAYEKPLSWFRNNVISTVPSQYNGAGRRVYPGFLQLIGFMSLNPDHHVKSHLDLFQLLTEGNKQEAGKIKEFYNEYLAVSDLPEKFYLDTLKHVFQDHTLPRGNMIWHGERVDPANITQTALFTVEGGKDNIVCPGQTLIAHALCKNLNPAQQYHHTEPGIGHYGVITGAPYWDNIMPRMAQFMRSAAEKRGIIYDPVTSPGTLIAPGAIDPAPIARYLNRANIISNGNPRHGSGQHRLAA